MLDPQSFGKLIAFNLKKNCDAPAVIHVPLKFNAAISAAGALVYSDTIDLSSFLRGNPAPMMSGIQTLICYQNSKSGNDLTNDTFGSEFIFNNGFKCFTPGRAYTALSVVADNTPRIKLNVFTIAALAAAVDVEIDYYFANFPIDQTFFKVTQ